MQVLAQPEGTVLWQRNTVLDGSDVSEADLPGAAASASAPGAGDETVSPEAGDTVPSASGGPAGAGDEDQVVPTLPPVPAVLVGAKHGAGTVHSVAASAANNHVYVPLPANTSYPNCAQGCIAVFGAQ